MTRDFPYLSLPHSYLLNCLPIYFLQLVKSVQKVYKHYLSDIACVSASNGCAPGCAQVDSVHKMYLRSTCTLTYGDLLFADKNMFVIRESVNVIRHNVKNVALRYFVVCHPSIFYSSRVVLRSFSGWPT